MHYIILYIFQILLFIILIMLGSFIFMLHGKQNKLSKQYDEFTHHTYTNEVNRVYDCINDIKTRYVPLDQFNDLVVKYVQTKSQIADTFNLQLATINDDININMRSVVGNFNEIQKTFDNQRKEITTLNKELNKLKNIIKQQFEVYNHSLKPQPQTSQTLDTLITKTIHFKNSPYALKVLNGRLVYVDISKQDKIINDFSSSTTKPSAVAAPTKPNYIV